MENTEEMTEVHAETTREETDLQKTAPKQEKRRKLSFSQIFCLSGSVVALVIQIIAVIFYATGLFRAFGRSITVVSAMELILLVFNINKAIVYRGIFGMLLGTLYYALLVLMLKCLGTAAVAATKSILRYKKNVVWWQGKAQLIAEIYFRTIARECLQTFESICIFMVISAAVTETEYETTILYLMAAFGVVAILRAIQKPIEERKGVVPALLGGLRECILFAALTLMLFLLRAPCVKTFIEGCSMLANGNLNTSMIRAAISSLYTSLVAPALLFALQILSLRLLDVYRYGADMGSVRRKLFILLLVFLALGLIFKCILISATSSVGFDTLTGWFNSIKNTYLPIVLLLLVLLLLNSLYGIRAPDFIRSAPGE